VLAVPPRKDALPVEFLSDDQASAYGSDDGDRVLMEPKRRDHNKLGFAVPLATIR
jgi:hypothetical protein